MLAREIILNRLKVDIHGPEKDNEELTSYPSDVYLTGILFPLFSQIAEEDRDQQKAESGGAQDGGDSSTDEVSLSSVKRPSSAGLSFAVINTKDNPSINIHLEAARYVATRVSAELNNIEDDEEPSVSYIWKREKLDIALHNVEINFNTRTIGKEVIEQDGLEVYIRSVNWDDKKLITVAVLNVNEFEAGADKFEIEEKTFFQVNLTITPADSNTRFHPRPLKTSAADEDAESSRLIYRDADEYAVGHTCSADWRSAGDANEIDELTTQWLPSHIVPAMSSSGDKIFDELSTDTSQSALSSKWLSENQGETLKTVLMQIPDLYLQWLETQRKKIEELSSDLVPQANKHLERAEVVAKRIRKSIEKISSDKQYEDAFRLANLAILTQRKWSYPDESDLVWRPFQLGFLLLSLISTADNTDENRNTADLLWFPTGGGKTEAYLGLIAFILFLRRIKHGDKGAGVTSIMRYTLRTLTVQQFQRATALICACEKIRLGEYKTNDIQHDYGNIPFSIGLWVGGDSVPNTVEKAAEAMTNLTGSTPKQLTVCPCGKQSKLFWRMDRNPASIKVSCSEDDCCWSTQKGVLPVWTVDEDIYRVRPSLIIGTVDKFAQIVRKKETVSLFDTDHKHLPPDLIIQDELHLISGPLGTLTGLYETAIDELCTSKGKKTKIIASTATIREAKAQISALFDRDTCLFPPPVIDASNSGFAVEDKELDGRLYVGVTTAGRSAKFTLQATSASLLQSAASTDIKDEVRDPYWSLVAYFNSLRELGGALVLMQDDVNQSLDDYSARRNEEPRDINNITELTSRVSSTEITEILDMLKLKFNQEGVDDILLASNMISVGVDIPRLGLMVVNGQPKGIAEYIQATSRVGRGKIAGLVVAIYNNAKSRDRSYYETFNTWHSSLYRDVEATSVTPFSSRARDRALHAVLVALVRHLIPDLRTKPTLLPSLINNVKDLAKLIVDRSANVDAEETDSVRDELDEIILRWSQKNGMRSYWNDRQINTSLLISAERAAELKAAGRAPGSAWPTPNSMRNVEPSTNFVLVEKLREKKESK
jgi:hypothetical protein